MSTEQSEGETQIDITQQATTPTTTTQREKNPKRVAAGKLVAERTRLARERQKKAAAEAAIIIETNKAKATTEAPEPAPTTEGGEEKNSGLSTNEWIAVGGLVVSLVGVFREEIKAAFSKKTPEPASVETQPSRATQPKLRKMD